MRAVLLALFLALAGCASQPSVIACPRLQEYPADMQRRVASALPSVGPDIARMIEDYGRLRAEIRAQCR